MYKFKVAISIRSSAGIVMLDICVRLCDIESLDNLRINRIENFCLNSGSSNISVPSFFVVLVLLLPHRAAIFSLSLVQEAVSSFFYLVFPVFDEMIF